MTPSLKHSIAKQIRLPIIFVSLTLASVNIANAQFDLNSKVGEAVAKAVKDGEPYHLDPASAFPDLGNRGPSFDPSTTHLVAGPDELKAPLKTGDYAVPIAVYGLMFGCHEPSTGQPYRLARLQGKLSQAITLLLVRGTMKGAAPEQLNAVVWRLEDGVVFAKLNESDKALVHDLIPEFEGAFNKDFLESVHSIFKGGASILFGGKSFESVLDDAGPNGKSFASLWRARKALTAKGGTDSGLPGVLWKPLGDNLPFGLPPIENPQPSPWAEVQNGVFIRLALGKGIWGEENYLEVHIGPRAAGKSSLGEVLAVAGSDAPATPDPSATTAIIAYPLDEGVEPLLVVPHFKA